MANPFTVDVVDPLQALLAGEQAYKEEVRSRALREFAAGDDRALLASGDEKLANLYMLAQQRKQAQENADRTFNAGRQDAAQSQANADRNHNLQLRRLNSELDTTPEGFERGSDGSLRPMAGGPKDPAYLGRVEEAKNPSLATEPLKNEQTLRKEFEGSTKPHMEVRRGYERLLSSRDDAVGDISLIFGYMKMLDPGSVVREGEFATAQNAAGIPDQVRNIYNRAISGERLNPTQRNMFKGQAKNLYDASEREYSARERQMRVLASKYRLNPDNIIPSIGPGPNAIVPELPAPPAGFQLVK